MGLILSSYAARHGDLSIGHIGILEIDFEPEAKVL
jgi:hypothetical protein